MSKALTLRIRPITGLTFAEKSILFQLADISQDGETVFFKMDTLILFAGCSLSTAKRILRRLERRGILLHQQGKKGRGSISIYRFNLDLPLPTPEEIPPTNGTRSMSPVEELDEEIAYYQNLLRQQHEQRNRSR